MRTLTVVYTTGESTFRKEFPRTPKGNRESIKFIRELHEKRRQHPFYHNLARIKQLDFEIKDWHGREGTSRKRKLQEQLDSLEKDRKEHMEICDVTEEPPVLKIEITQN